MGVEANLIVPTAVSAIGARPVCLLAVRKASMRIYGQMQKDH
jgi:hypothetical protein